MSWYSIIRFLHIITAFMFIGGIFGRQLVRAYAKKTDNIQVFAALTRAARRIENIMILLESALEKGQFTAELRTVLDDKAAKFAHLYEEISAVIIVALMVLKPF